MQRNQYTFLFRSLVLALVLVASNQANASHLMGGNITYTYQAPGQYAVSLSLFRDCNGITLGTTATVRARSVSCNNQNITINMTNIGGPIVRTPLCANADDACDPGSSAAYGVEEYIYRGVLNIPPGCGDDWVLTYSVCCRNGAITTLSNGASESLTIQSRLNNTLLPEGNNSPAFNNPPTLFLCNNQENRYNSGMTDLEGDDLVYSLVNCKDTETADVAYAGTFNGQNPLAASTATVDPLTGEVVIVPIANQVAVICILVEEFRNGVKIGEVLRDLQFTVTDCAGNTLPKASGINGTAGPQGTTGSYSTTACAGSEICLDIEAFDPEYSGGLQTLDMNWNYGIAATFVVDYTSQANPVGQLCWTPTQADTGENFFYVELEDNACPFLGNNVYTYRIFVYDGVEATIAQADTFLNPGDSIRIAANINDPNATISWSPTTGLSCTDCPNPMITPTPGTITTYTVTATNAQGCTDTAAVTLETFSVNTHEVTALNGWTIFPNPMQDQATVRYNLDRSSDVRLVLHDMLGREIARIVDATQTSGEHTYHLGEYLQKANAGMYFLSIEVNGQRTTRKLMKR